MTPTPSDLHILASFLYGPRYVGPWSDDAGIRAENLRRLVQPDARRNPPPALVEFMLRRVADRWLLRGWQDQAPPAGLSIEISAELERRIDAARSEAAVDRPANSPERDGE